MVESYLFRKTAYRPPQADGGGSAGKSARRMLEILEFFGAQRRPLSVREIAAHFGYPHSSTSVLVNTAATLGYLGYDLTTRTYSATLRLAVLGAWVYETTAVAGDVLNVARELAARTNETVVIAAENDIYSQYIHVVPSTQSIQYYIPTGNRLLLCHSGTGWALLSTHSEDSIERLVDRTRVRLGKAVAAITFPEVLARVNEVRRRGYAFSRGAVVPGGGIIAVSLPSDQSGVRLALGVASTLQRLDTQAEQVIKWMRAGVRKLAPRAAKQPLSRPRA